MRIFKRKSTKTTSWGYDIYHESLPKGREQKSGFKTRPEAQNKARERLNELDNGISSNHKVYVETYMYDWLKGNKLGFITEKTYKRYQFPIKTFIDYFGNVELKDVFRKEYQLFLNEYGKTRAHTTV